MTSIKSFAVPVGLAALILIGQVSAAYAISLNEAERATEKFLQRVVDQKLDELATYLGEDPLFGKHSAGAWQQPVEGIKSIFRLADASGSKLTYEKINQKNLGNSLVSLRYAVTFPESPMLVEVMLYNRGSEWEFLNVDFQFGTNAIPVLKAWFNEVD